MDTAKDNGDERSPYDIEVARRHEVALRVRECLLNQDDPRAGPDDRTWCAAEFQRTPFIQLLDNTDFAAWLDGGPLSPQLRELAQRLFDRCMYATFDQVMALEREALRDAEQRGDALAAKQHRKNIEHFEAEKNAEAAKAATIESFDVRRASDILTEASRMEPDEKRRKRIGQGLVYLRHLIGDAEPRIALWREALAELAEVLEPDRTATALARAAAALREMAEREKVELSHYVNPSEARSAYLSQTETLATTLEQLPGMVTDRLDRLGRRATGRPSLRQLARLEAILSGRLEEARGRERPVGSLSFVDLARLDLDGQSVCHETVREDAGRIRMRVNRYVEQSLAPLIADLRHELLDVMRERAGGRIGPPNQAEANKTKA